MAKKSAPIGGIVGRNQTANAIDAMDRPEIGVTAGDVIRQPRQVRSNFEFQARGGVQNTVREKVQEFQDKMKFKEQQRQFEKYLAGKEQTAQAAYDEVTGKDPETKYWIPHPDMFYDEGTGAFMPVKYAEAFATGYKEYQKDKTAKSGQELQGKKLDQSIGYQNASIAQRDQALGLQQRGVESTEANTLISATNSAESARKNAQQEFSTREKTLRDDITKYSDVIRKSMVDSSNASNIGDDESKKKAEGEISAARSAQAKAMKELTTHLSEKTGEKYDPEAIDMAVKLQMAAEDSSPEATPISLQSYITEVMQSEDYKPSPDTPDKEGNPSSIAQQVSDLAKEIHIYAWSKGIKTPGFLKRIEDALNAGKTVEDLIQGIIIQSGAK